jgi:hypothetical protein
MWNSDRSPSRKRCGSVLIGGILLAAAVAFAAPVAAHPKHRKARAHRSHAQTIQRHGPHRVRGYADFAAPQVMRFGHAERSRPYYVGRAYYRPHHHRHAVYDFPVYRRGRYVYQRHYYCNARLYHRGHLAYAGPRVSLRVGF